MATTTTTHRTSSLPEDISDKISYAFQLATAQGPLCHEPMQGVAVFLEDVSIAASLEHEGIAPEMTGSMTGEAIKTVRDAIRQGFLDWSPRLMLAMYSCEIQASSESFILFLFVSFFFWHPLMPLKILYACPGYPSPVPYNLTLCSDHIL